MAKEIAVVTKMVKKKKRKKWEPLRDIFRNF